MLQVRSLSLPVCPLTLHSSASRDDYSRVAEALPGHHVCAVADVSQTNLITRRPNVLALNLGSTLTQSLLFLVIFLAIACLLLYLFRRFTAQLESTATREGLQSQNNGTGWRIMIVSVFLILLYLPLSTIAVHALLWSSDFWVVPNPYLNATTLPPVLPPLGPPEIYRDPLDFCYTTTMMKEQINYAPVIVILSAVTFVIVRARLHCLVCAVLMNSKMTFWFPIRLSRAIALAVPHVDPYTEMGKKRTHDEMDSEYMKIMDRDNSPFSFLYNGMYDCKVDFVSLTDVLV